MKKTLSLLFLLACLLYARAVEIPKGTFYFNNSKTQYSTVKFLYGKSSESITYIIALDKQDGDIWKLVIPEAKSGMTHYFFSNTSLPIGTYAKSISSLKDDIAGSRGEMRTSTVKDSDNKPMIVGYTFTPITGDQWAQGNWLSGKSSSTTWSGTLPVLYLNTANKAEVTDRETYLDATAYIDALGLDGYENMASKDSPVELQIKGHGNWTFRGFDKKPFRLKFTDKVTPLGMSANRHYVLMACADDNYGFMKNYVGFELSRRMHLPYTPAMQPVELVYNGNYRGLYFLTEKIRIGKNRVNITEQEDEDTDAENITGGWLVEVDNYDTDPHITTYIGGKTVWVTYHSPETLSTAQKNFLQSEFDAIANGLNTSNKNSTEWEKYIDMESLARVYVTREIMQDEEGFHGSCYMYRDRGNNEKWHFGPVWDFGNSYNNGIDSYIFEHPEFTNYIIGEAWNFPRFQTVVKDVWADFYNEGYPTMSDFIDSYASLITPATLKDYDRWPSYGTSNESGKASDFKNKMKEKVAWLVGKWGTVSSGISVASQGTEATPVWYDLQGRKIGEGNISLPSGIYIQRIGNISCKVMK